MFVSLGSSANSAYCRFLHQGNDAFLVNESTLGFLADGLVGS